MSISQMRAALDKKYGPTWTRDRSDNQVAVIYQRLLNAKKL